MVDRVISDINQERRDAHNEVVDDIDNLRTNVGTIRTLVNELKLDYAALLADVTAIRTKVVDAVADIATLMGGDTLMSDPNLAIGTSSAAKIKHDAFTVRIDGVERLIAAGEVAFTATTHDIADPDTEGREAIYVVSIGGADTVPTITKGDDAALAAAIAPATPANHVKLGEVKVAHDGSAIFDASTDLLSAAHITDTYTDATPGAQQSAAPAALTASAIAAADVAALPAKVSGDITKN